MNTTPSDPDHEPTAATGGPAWGTPPTQPPSGSGTDEQHSHYHDHPGPSDPGEAAGTRFFDGVRAMGIVRPDRGRWVAGVCAGLARRWGLNPMLVRGLFLLFGLVTGIGLAVYGVLWLLLPHPDGRIHAQQVLGGTVTAGFVGGVLAVLADGPFGASPHAHGSWHGHQGLGLLPVALVVLAVWWLTRRHHRTRHQGC